MQLLWGYGDDWGPFIGENFMQERFWPKILKSVFGPIFDFGGIFQGLDINFEFSTPKKAHPCVRPRRLNHRAWKSAGCSQM